MNSHRINELIALLQPAWEKDADLNLLQFLQKLAQESGFQGEITDMTDDTLIYHLKMRGSAQTEVIPGLKKDYEEDFKTAILRARGVIKE
ncbi:MAG: YihD family protein [Yersiniaceae bacterium]|nr:YihD family protein [Yersiniaceae bacterium]